LGSGFGGSGFGSAGFGKPRLVSAGFGAVEAALARVGGGRVVDFGAPAVTPNAVSTIAAAGVLPAARSCITWRRAAIRSANAWVMYAAILSLRRE
jgi:hypothetical protein